MIKRFAYMILAVILFTGFFPTRGVAAPMGKDKVIKRLDKAVAESVDSLKASDRAVKATEEALSNAESSGNSVAVSHIGEPLSKVRRIFNGQRKQFKKVQESARELRGAVSSNHVEREHATVLVVLIEANKNILKSEARRAEVMAHYASMIASSRNRHMGAVKRQLAEAEQTSLHVRQHAMRIEKTLGFNMSKVGENPVSAARMIESMAATKNMDVRTVGRTVDVMGSASNAMTRKMSAHERLVRGMVSMDERSISEAEDSLAVISQVAETMVIMSQEVATALDSGDIAAIEEVSALAQEADTYIETTVGDITDGTVEVDDSVDTVSTDTDIIEDVDIASPSQ